MSTVTTPMLHVLDWCGSALGLIGAYMLAFRFRGSRYGWFAFFAANGFYVAMASTVGLPGLLAQQLGYSVSSAIGIYRYVISKATMRLEQAREDALTVTRQLAAFDPNGASPSEELASLIGQARAVLERLEGTQRPLAFCHSSPTSAVWTPSAPRTGATPDEVAHDMS